MKSCPFINSTQYKTAVAAKRRFFFTTKIFIRVQKSREQTQSEPFAAKWEENTEFEKTRFASRSTK